MVEMAQEEKRPSGCGLMVLYNGVFRRRSSAPSSSRSASSVTVSECTPCPAPAAGGAVPRRPPPCNTDASLVALSSERPRAPVARPPSNAPSQMPPSQRGGGGAVGQPRPQLKAMPSISTELENFIYDHQHAKGGSTLVRASSSNVMLFGDLGNLRGAANQPMPLPASNAPNHLSRGMHSHPQHGNGREIGGDADGDSKAIELASTFSRQLNPDELKDMGNEEYKMGRYEEALVLYDRAIALDPVTASYWSNKAAALIGLGRFLEAVTVCREAVRIDPGYCRAHHRLANLFLRLGIADKALHHYRAAGKEASPADFAQTKTLQNHLAKSNEARKVRNWQALLKASQSAVTSGADSSPQVFASQAEALLKLQRHDGANDVLIDAPIFDVDESTKFFGPAANAYFLSIRAEVNMAAGRFDEAVSLAQKAALMDASNKDVATVARRARAVALSRSRGNELFKASKFSEASDAYGEGLDHDPHNSVLLCNRAASLSKLGEWERAIEDCNLALKVRPSYHKALLRRADCYAKLEQWEASISDYEALAEEMPSDEEVRKSLLDVRRRLNIEKKKKKEAMENEENKEAMKCANNVTNVKTNDQYNQIITAHGTCVAYFCNSDNDSKQIWLYVEQLCRQYPSVNFLKVDEEDSPSLVKSEEVSLVPSFTIYKNGFKVKELSGYDHDLLDSSLRVFSI